MSTTESSIPIENASRSAWVVQLFARIPYYLLSGACLFAGCFLISAALRSERDQLGPVLALLGVVTLYEWLALGLGLLLIARRGLTRDGGYLLLLTTLLLSDWTFVYNELTTMSATVGGAINAAAVGLGLLKVALIARVVRFRLHVRQWGILALNLLVLMALPLIFRSLSQAGALSTSAYHGIWWAAGLWMALQAFASSREVAEPMGLTTLPALRVLMQRAVLAVPAGAVLLHLAAGHFVYEVPFYAAHLAPVLLGLAIYLAVTMREREPTCRFVFVLGMMSLACAWMAPPSLIVTELQPAAWTFSPLRGALLVAAMAWIGTAWRHLAGWLVLPAALSLGLAITGATPRDLIDRVSRWGEWLRDMPGSLLPTSLLQWGMLTLGLAFVLLVLGGLVSLYIPKRVADHHEISDSG